MKEKDSGNDNEQIMNAYE